jgi:hypothetical protein
MPKYQVAVVLAGVVVLTGCGAAREESAPAPRFKPADLARMVRKQQLGPLARGLKLDREQTGPSNNKQGAKDTLDLRDSARSLRKAGRLRGYDLTYSGSGLSGLGVVQVAESVELFRSEQAASRWLKKQLADYVRYRGKKHDGVKLASVEELDADTGEEAGGLRLRFTFPGHGIAIYATVVGFRRGTVVGSTSVLLRRNVLVAGDVERIADALDDRIVRVGSGKARGAPLMSKRVTPRPVADPKPFLIEAGELPFRTKLVHADYFPVPGDGRVYLREYDVLGTSGILYVRTMAQAFPTARAAEANQEYLGSRKGSDWVARRFLRAYFAKTKFTPQGVSAQPLWRGDDAAGFNFFFRAPKGRIEGVELSVRQGRLSSTLLVMGFDRAVDPAGLLRLRGKLRARLSGAESAR